MKTYQGTCHCGAVEFSIEADMTELIHCDCSLCSKKNALMVTVRAEHLQVIKGQNALSLYQWNTGKAEHYFCSTCGIYTFNRRRMNPNLYSVNAWCLAGLDVASLPLRHVDGKHR
ncbi:Glutathione-dependent formaldehyde-activating enzyme [compost metagenome]